MSPTSGSAKPLAIIAAGVVALVTACGGGSETPASPTVSSAPPFSGTIFIDRNIITDADPTTFQSLTSKGEGVRTMFDRRVGAFVQLSAHLFDAIFSDALVVEVQVNTEFGGTDAARVQAEKYAVVVGRLPRALRVSVRTMWIHQGVQPFGGGNQNLLIHVGQGDLYEAAGILEETLVHEAVHTSLDAAHATAGGWVAAQSADGRFISTYARDNPQREDLAESFVPYLAARFQSARVSPTLVTTIQQTIPNRIVYFDSLGLAMLPVR